MHGDVDLLSFDSTTIEGFSRAVAGALWSDDFLAEHYIPDPTMARQSQTDRSPMDLLEHSKKLELLKSIY